MGGFAASGNNGFENTKTLLKHVEPGKEYYFKCGEHAAIVRKNNNTFEFLELQGVKKANGFQILDQSVLKKRFGSNNGKIKRAKQSTYYKIL